jgi:7,8-dihydropterin-6-yl-methyl-4-(beta-D-ribofuranosyl)aminobenzene 5'-phosphate synthase
MVTNADRLGADLSQIQSVVLSHGHFDHGGAVLNHRSHRVALRTG